MNRRLMVEGMSCQHCVRRVTRYLESVPNVSAVNVDLDAKEAVFQAEGTIDMDGIVHAINDFGFTVKEKKK